MTRIEYCHTIATSNYYHRNNFLSQGDYLVIERNFLSQEKISWYKGKFLVTVGFHPVRTRPSPHSSIFRGEYFTIFQNRIFGKGFHSIVVLDRVSLFWWIFLNTFDIFDENPFLQSVTSEPTVPPSWNTLLTINSYYIIPRPLLTIYCLFSYATFTTLFK